LTVKRIDSGLFDATDGGPRETVAVDTFSEAVARRDRGIFLSFLSAAVSAIASLAFVAAERWLLLVDILKRVL
jgi:hypothetical protein